MQSYDVPYVKLYLENAMRPLRPIGEKTEKSSPFLFCYHFRVSQP